jgi:hypothetical protein
MASTNTNATLELLAKIASALQTKLPAGTVALKVSGVVTPVTSILTSVQTDLALYTDARDARLVERQKVAARDAQDVAVHARIATLHKALEMELGESNAALADFGFKPKQQRRQLTPAEKSAKKAKAAATRAKNGTLGKRQKRMLDANAQAPPTGGPAKA